MAKKRKFYPSKKILLACTIIISAVAYYFNPWTARNNDKKTYSPHRYTLSIIPEISNESPIIQQTFEKGDIKCITTYNITTRLPIYIQRYYPNEKRTEYLILRPLDLYAQNVDDMYELVKNSKEHIGAFEDQVIKAYSTKMKTRSRIFQQNLRMNMNSSYLTLGIWYRKEGETTERLVGSLTIDPNHQTEKAEENEAHEGVYGSYFTGDPAYTKVHGIMRVSFEATVNHLLYTGNIKHNIILVTDKKNKKSNNLAKKLRLKKHEASEIFPKTEWNYPMDIHNAFLYKISVKKWKKHNWKAKQVKKETKK